MIKLSKYIYRKNFISKISQKYDFRNLTTPVKIIKISIFFVIDKSNKLNFMNHEGVSTREHFRGSERTGNRQYGSGRL